ncbi:MAG: hypothetical protein KTR13_01295, partial [Saprospiraceae bacterium]|nr:hypothetical protein [Saprospiraceae bacterium]
MSNWLKLPIALILILSNLAVSGGITVYSHACKMENSFETSFARIEHQCSVEVRNSCHQSSDKKDDCCTSEAEQEQVEQIKPASSVDVSVLLGCPIPVFQPYWNTQKRVQ